MFPFDFFVFFLPMAFFVSLGDSLRHDCEKDASFNFFAKRVLTLSSVVHLFVNLHKVAMFSNVQVCIKLLFCSEDLYTFPVMVE